LLFEIEVGVHARVLSKKMDCRFKPGNDVSMVFAGSVRHDVAFGYAAGTTPLDRSNQR
jgi:hypothetical protein